MSYFSQQDYDSEPTLKAGYFQCPHCVEIDDERVAEEYNGGQYHYNCLEVVKWKQEQAMISWWLRQDTNDVIRGNFNEELYEEKKDRL